MSNPLFELPVVLSCLSRWRSTLTVTFWVGGEEVSIDVEPSLESHRFYDAFKNGTNMVLSLKEADASDEEQ